jgi:hypothetical protein
MLKQVETNYPLVGTSLLDVFFPVSLGVKGLEDIEFWRAALNKEDGAKRPRHATGLSAACYGREGKEQL